MVNTSVLSFLKKYFQERFILLLAALLGLMVLGPLLEGFVRLQVFMDICITVVFVSCILAVSNTNRTFFITVFLALPMFLAMWIPAIENSPVLHLIGNISGILFIAFVVVLIVSFIFRKREVDANIIFASIVNYLLLGVMWIFIYQAIEIIQPGSFSLPEHAASKAGDLFTYYSFVTLTTLGYGDITPVSRVAGAFATLEAVIGQIYLVVLVARLVGLNIAQTMERNKTGG